MGTSCPISVPAPVPTPVSISGVTSTRRAYACAAVIHDHDDNCNYDHYDRHHYQYQCTTGGVTVSVNYRLGNVAAVWEEYQKFEQERQKAGKKSLGISRKYQKQLNNKKRVVEEVEYQAEQFRAADDSLNRQDVIQRAISELDVLFKVHSWTVNQLINYCRDQKAAREAA
ncbi:hypothetical protein K457DRAFT_25807 [Linnemannia elongata AG-77]|uniref:Uncharacterized protein n=1 Tax=Linnemannia elongata AG-77 TaxID=1314771 RepID=A0A197JDY8_9FUNG|nr:hypothetical protein K457DRAFT_25807 [Linnemannia elongata AG-77]